MKLITTDFEGLYIVEPKVFKDDRGYFLESYSEKIFKEADIHHHFVQDNESKSKYGVIRGLHYQLAPMAQAKLVKVVLGEVLDVVVDIRKSSPTFGKSFSIKLSEENKLQLLIPRGFAHGFAVLSPECIFQYKCDNYYAPDHDRGILYSDSALGIDWLIPEHNRILSAKDLQHPTLNNCENNFD